MGGTIPGGKAAAATNKLKYGKDYYSKIGAIGGKNSTTGGFASGSAGRERARYWGKIGGTKSKRGSKA